MSNLLGPNITFPGQGGGVIFAFIALAVVCLVAWRWLRAKRARRLLNRGLCPACKYSRSGLGVETACPECGSVPPRQRG